MDALHTAFPESESVAGLETTIRRSRRIRKALRPSDAGIQTLFALRMHQNLGEVDGGLERSQALGCIAWDDDEYPALTHAGYGEGGPIGTSAGAAPEWKEFNMNRDIVEGNWKQGLVKTQWNEAAHDHRDVIVGKRGELAGKSHKASPRTECTMKREIPPRRLVLRGALLLGCSSWVPIALVGCDAKKDMNSTRTAPPGAPATSAGSAAPAATSKVSPESVQYQAQPKGDQKCSGCLHFIAESNTCKLVAGQVSPEGWCSLWAKKA